MLYSFLTFFFFFKQKTAYEMRISDWSSDVCSSDLAKAAGTAMSSITYHYGGKEGLYLAAADYIVSQMDDGAHPIEGDGLPKTPDAARRAIHKALAGFIDKLEIGRASCRERVCQYV